MNVLSIENQSFEVGGHFSNFRNPNKPSGFPTRAPRVRCALTDDSMSNLETFQKRVRNPFNLDFV